MFHHVSQSRNNIFTNLGKVFFQLRRGLLYKSCCTSAEVISLKKPPLYNRYNLLVTDKSAAICIKIVYLQLRTK